MRKTPKIKQALLYERADGKLRCLTCERHCRIGPGERGFCQTRENIDGKLYTLVYGEIAPSINGIQANPIEKKPFFHFWPGTNCLTVGTWSCNFTCPWCQNYDISKHPDKIWEGYFLSPEEFVRLVDKTHCQGTSISFNEPTLLFEYALDVFDLARKKGLYNTYVTNGYMTEEALKLLIDHGLDGMNIDIKGDEEAVKKYCQADVEVVWRNARIAKESGVWVELTTLVIPGINDGEECLRGIATRIRDEMGKDTPWHVSGYYPAYKFASEFYVPPIPIEVLERARKIGKEEGLNYIYFGNFPGHPYENTYCPKCNQLLIERYGFKVTKYILTSHKRCPNCGEEIPLIGHF
jgi:pyruvate formate lyase activating enzyme